MSDENRDPLGKALGIDPIPSSMSIVDKMEVELHDDSASKDFEQARANILNMIDTTKDAIDVLAEIAESSQNPRAYEVLGKLVDSYVAANKDLLNMQEKIRSIKNVDAPIGDKAKSVTQNNLFVGSTAELQKFLKGWKENG